MIKIYFLFNLENQNTYLPNHPHYFITFLINHYPHQLYTFSYLKLFFYFKPFFYKILLYHYFYLILLFNQNNLQALKNPKISYITKDFITILIIYYQYLISYYFLSIIIIFSHYIIYNHLYYLILILVHPFKNNFIY